MLIVYFMFKNGTCDVCNTSIIGYYSLVIAILHVKSLQNCTFNMQVMAVSLFYVRISDYASALTSWYFKDLKGITLDKHQNK
jgi:hypothetical protein